MATQDDYIRTALRVPPELHARIHESAKSNQRTFNAEIVARLEASFVETGSSRQAGGSEVDQLRDELAGYIARKRKNQEILEYLREAGIPSQEIALAFEREFRENSPKAMMAAQRLRELGEVEVVRQITKIPRKQL